MRTLIIAEKKSVAQTLATFLNANNNGNYFANTDYAICYAAGHLLKINTDSLTPSNQDGQNIWNKDVLPIFPNQYKLTADNNKKHYLSAIKKVYESFAPDRILNFCDAAREGELIFRYISTQLKFPNNIVYRAWPKSMQKDAVLMEIKNSKQQNHYEGLYQSALARAHSDWLFGINLTMACTVHFNTLHYIGRVQTPILKIITDRYNENKNFVSKPFFTLNAKVAIDEQTSIPVKLDKEFPSSQEAHNFDKSNNLFLHSQEVKEKVTSPPTLYNLNDIQIDANKYFNYSPKETLDILQSLYEKGFISYPRSDSNYLMEDMKTQMSSILDALNTKYSFNANIDNNNSCFNSNKVSDHYAIIPLVQEPKITSQSDLSIFFLILQRCLVSFSKPFKTNTHNFVFFTTENDHDFDPKWKGKVTNLTEPGYLHVMLNFCNIFNKLNSSAVSYQYNSKFSDLNIGSYSLNTYYPADFETKSEKTKPKPLYNFASLLAILDKIQNYYKENNVELTRSELSAIKDAKGIGTPATRGNIINNLLTRKMIAEQKKSLVPTELGIQIIKNISETDFINPAFSAYLEHQLDRIYKQEITYDEAIKIIQDNITNYLSQIYAKIVTNANNEIDFECPNCQERIYKSKYSYMCNGKHISVPIEFCGYKIDKKTAVLLLKGGQTDFLDLKSKTGNKFKAKMKFDITTNKIQMEFKNKR